VPNQRRADSRPDIDKGGGPCKRRAYQQADRNGDLEAGIFLREEDSGRPDGVEAEEAPGGHKGKREEQDAGIPTPVGRLTGRVSENERDTAHDPEDDEVRPVVLEVRVQLRAKQ
jgi:hypothetical protein